MVSTREEIQEALAKMDAKVIAESQEMITELMQKTVMSGIRPKTALQLSDEVLEGIYGYAYNMYNRGMYKEASHIFRLLIMLDYTQSKYLMGLGASLHMIKDYQAAITIYTMCGLMSDDNPLPHYHAADCYLKLDEAAEATFELGQALEKAGKDKKYEVLIERCKLMIESLKEQVDEQYKESQRLKSEAKKDKLRKKSK